VHPLPSLLVVSSLQPVTTPGKRPVQKSAHTLPIANKGHVIGLILILNLHFLLKGDDFQLPILVEQYVLTHSIDNHYGDH
jgi:hypothetical protein